MKRIFLDTNVYIIGAQNRLADEGRILAWLGWWRNELRDDIEVIVSQELLDQVTRVAKRLQNKDWSGELIDRIWRNLNTHYVLLDEQTFYMLEQQAIIPREDIGVYLTAQAGKADCFVSANHKLIRTLVSDTQEFECLTPAELVSQYIYDSSV